MKPALRIFRKDVRHLWPRIAIVLALGLLVGWIVHARPPGPSEGAGAVLGWIMFLASWYLIASVIHQEAIPGNRQYWLTRPISRRDLLAAKLIFLLVFLCLPDFLVSAADLVVHGKPPLAYLPGLLAGGVSTLAWVLPVAALAAITAGLVEFVAAALAAWVAFGVGTILLMSTRAYSPGAQVDYDWGGLVWMRGAAVAALLLTAAAAALLLQYSRRRTWLSRGILAAALVMSPWLLLQPWGWHTAFALESRLSGQPVAGTVARIVFDPARDPSLLPRFGRQWIPVQVTGIPAGMALCSDRVAVTVETPGGTRRTSGWQSQNALVRLAGTAPDAWKKDERLLTGDGGYWLRLGNLFGRSSAPIHLRAKLALTLLSPENVTLLEPCKGTQASSQNGFCRVSQDGSFWVTFRRGVIATGSSWPVRTPARLGLRPRPRDGDAGQRGEPALWWDSVGSYCPYPVSGDWQQTGGTFDPPPADLDLVTREAVAHFERDLDIPDLREWTAK
jgi:hypothetical protein